MARARLTDFKEDINNDSGAVLWSLVKGEQLEFPITLNFIENQPIVVNGMLVHPATYYQFETVVVEAANVELQETKPVVIQPDGVNKKLVTRIPVFRGTWDSQQAYNKEEIVFSEGLYWRLMGGVTRVNSLPPSEDRYWSETTLNTIFLQFPANLIQGWAVQPSVGTPVYGFFEMRVTEPPDQIFQRTWKPVRGMVEVLFSPTEHVPD